MNALSLELLHVAKQYLGPAAPDFLSRELHALGVTANTIESSHVLPLAARARTAAAKVMDSKRAGQFAQALADRGTRIGRERRSGRRLASTAAATHLAGGRLRQAEREYREQIRRRGDVDSYAGLARTLISLDDRDGALTVLREGAAQFAKKGDRASAVLLLAAAVELAPNDLNAHRRLAAALANQGDLVGACEEYARFIEVVLAQRDVGRAWLELTYGRETLGDRGELAALADHIAAAQHPSAPAEHNGSTRAAAIGSAWDARLASQRMGPAGSPSHAHEESAAPKSHGGAAHGQNGRPTMIGLEEVRPPAAQSLASPSPAPTPATRASAAPAAGQPVSAPPISSEARTRPHASTAVVLKDASTVTHAVDADLVSPAELLSSLGVLPTAGAAEMPATGLEAELKQLVPCGEPSLDALSADSRASLLIAAGDPRATDAVLDAARRLLALGKLNAASDVLLGYIAAGFRDREAQRLLIEINCELGQREVAREKCQLLGTAYRLDGRASIAGDVERLARIL